MIILNNLAIYGQQVVGIVYDSKSKEPVPFATISIKNTTQGVVADADGRFTLKAPSMIAELVITAIGYKKITIIANTATEILLPPSNSELTEVVVYNKNPANKIIVEAIAHKDKNDPEKLQSYKCQIYQKTNISALNDSLNESSKLGQRLKNSDLYINESVIERNFAKPNLIKEIVVGSKTSGSNGTLFASLSPVFQQFGFYKDYIRFESSIVRDQFNMVSPLVNGTLDRYKFYMLDTLVQNSDTTYVIEFEPKPKANFSGLKGMLHIHAGTYALQYVQAEPADRNILHFKLEQYYTKVKDKEMYFPDELMIEWYFNDFKIGKQKVVYKVTSYISKVQIDPPIPSSFFDENALIIKQNAPYQTEEFWKTNRVDSLTVRDKSTYEYHQRLSLRKKIRQNAVLNGVEWYNAGIVPLGKKIDWVAMDFLDANIYEGFRPTLNLATNENFNKYFRIDGKLGYGTNDKALKSEARIKFFPEQKYKSKVSLSYRQDISEPGNVQYFVWNNVQIPYEVLRTFMISRADSLRQYKFEYTLRPFKNTSVSFSLVDEFRKPTYDYVYMHPMYERSAIPMYNFHNQEFNIGVRYAYGERFSQFGRGSVTTGVPSPSILFNYISGQLMFKEGKSFYQKLNAKIEYQIKSPKLGETFLNLSAGKVWGNVPYPFLFNGRGSKLEGGGNTIWVGNHFNTMGLYEFTSNTYSNLFITHNFGKLLAKPKAQWIQPDVSVFQGLAYGSIENKEHHKMIDFGTLEKVYRETGLMVDNILRLKMAKIARLGIGAGVFYRWGPYKLPANKDNITTRLVWNVTL